jgi:molybdate transport system ATP-binding protein
MSMAADPGQRGLHASVHVHRPGHRLDVELAASSGDVVAVVGPNGSGKTTLLRALAGLQELTSGRIVCHGRTWDDPDGGGRVSAPQRQVGMVLQEILLFPHLSVLDNVAFGPRSRGASRLDARRTAEAWLERIGVSDLTGDRTSSPGARLNGSPSPARSPPTRCSSSSTSRSPRSTSGPR